MIEIPKMPTYVIQSLPDDLPDNKTSYYQNAGSYDEYEIETSFPGVSGIISMPSTATGLPFAAVGLLAGGAAAASLTYLGQNLPIQLTSEVTQVVMTWKAKKIGDAPTLPPRTSANPNLTWTKQAVICSGVETTVDGLSLVTTITGVYYYDVKDPNQLRYVSPFFPWTNVGSLTPPPNTQNTGNAPVTPYPTQDDLWNE